MNILILGGARDFHAIDWYRSMLNIRSKDHFFFATDTFSSEGLSYSYNVKDEIYKLFIIDKYLFKEISSLGSIWRNLLKLLVLPIQVFYLLHICKHKKIDIVHAHPMYYMLLCFLSNIKYIGTPQGSEILVRPWRSKLYKIFASKILDYSKLITVDSLLMKDKIKSLSSADVTVVQNGIDTFFFTSNNTSQKSIPICSFRGLTDLYRIEEIFISRNKFLPHLPILSISPFQDSNYSKKVSTLSHSFDRFCTKLSKKDFAFSLGKVFLAVSIPKSDSSPRSVYEAIFSGAFVATSYLPWVDDLPESMYRRLILCNLREDNWLEVAYHKASQLSCTSFEPCQVSLSKFDQYNSMQNFHPYYQKVLTAD